MYCLWCDEEIIIEINWDNLFKLSKPQLLCDKCMNQLEMIEGDRCVKCSRSYQGELCFDCQRWTDKDPLIFNYSLYTYNEQMQEMIARWKYRRDYVLATIFREYYVKTFVKIFSFLGENIYIIPIPLSEDRMMERGFNQAKVLADFLPYQQKNVMQRIFSEKQSKKTRFERISKIGRAHV